MSLLVVLVVIAVVLFILGFVTKRRFGILGLALFAGSYLAHTWTGAATPLIEKTGLDFSSIGVPAAAIVGAVLTILPSLVLLANSPKYSGKWTKIVGAAAFAALAVILLIPLLDSAFAASGASQTIVQSVERNYTMLVTVGIIAAVVDLFLSRGHKAHSKKHSEH